MYNHQDDDNEEEDFLEEIIRDRTKENPLFPAMVEALSRQRDMLWAIGEGRKKSGLSQAEVAARIGITQDELDGLEYGETDPRLSVLSRLAAALGMQLEVRLVPALAEEAAPGPAPRRSQPAPASS